MTLTERLRLRSRRGPAADTTSPISSPGEEALPIAGYDDLHEKEVIAHFRELSQVEPTYDNIIIDLPSFKLLPAAAIQHLPAWLLVTEWGKTPRDQVRHLLENEYLVRDPCLGVVLNKVNMVRLRSY